MNALAAGVPAIVWREQGFLDVLGATGYPTVVQSIDEALGWVARLVSDAGLRAHLAQLGLAAAAPFSLERLSERFALILADVISRPQATW